MVDDAPVTEDWLLDNSETRDVVKYSNAAFEALFEALPAPDAEASADPTPPQNGASLSASHGASTSTSPSGTSISVQQSSGTG
jgi:hypothetical protein